MDNYKEYDSDLNFSEADTQWQNVSAPIVKFDSEQLESPKNLDSTPAKVKHPGKHPVLTFQLVVALCVLLLLFAIKFADNSLYSRIISLYQTKISESVIFNGDFESLDFSFLMSTDDEA